MPRKLRTPKARVDVPLTCAVEHILMTGEHAVCRVHGWAALAIDVPLAEEEAYLQSVWAQHRAWLIEAARRHAFEPYWLHRQAPTGAGVEQWRRLFLERARY